MTSFYFVLEVENGTFVIGGRVVIITQKMRPELPSGSPTARLVGRRDAQTIWFLILAM